MRRNAPIRLRWDRIIWLVAVVMSGVVAWRLVPADGSTTPAPTAGSTTVRTPTVSSAEESPSVPPSSRETTRAPTGPAVGGCPARYGRVLTQAPGYGRTVALTFDDGPSQWTPQVLEVLDRYDVSATFFVVGREADRRRDVLAEIAGAGHLVATHTWNHEPGPPGDAWPRSWIEAEMLTTQAVVREVTGADTCWFRPPRGALHGVANAAANWPLDVALWSVDTRDWKIQAGVEPAGDPAPGLAEQVLANAAPAEGERHPVVLLHDGGGYRGGTVAALPAVIELYRDLGYRFVRLDERERQGPGAEWG